MLARIIPGKIPNAIIPTIAIAELALGIVEIGINDEPRPRCEVDEEQHVAR
jgi:hypothetical protein